MLRKEGEEIAQGYPNLDSLISNMFETMYNAQGVGLAAPQVGLSIRLFVVDTTPFVDEEDPETEDLRDFKKVFINAWIEEEDGEEFVFNEGCLSIPDIRGDVDRLERIKIRYLDENCKSRLRFMTA